MRFEVHKNGPTGAAAISSIRREAPSPRPSLCGVSVSCARSWKQGVTGRAVAWQLLHARKHTRQECSAAQETSKGTGLAY